MIEKIKEMIRIYHIENYEADINILKKRCKRLDLAANIYGFISLVLYTMGILIFLYSLNYTINYDLTIKNMFLIIASWFISVMCILFSNRIDETSNFFYVRKGQIEVIINNKQQGENNE